MTRLVDAFRLQFQWVSVLITDRSHHTSGERKRAILFALLHAAFGLVVLSHLLTPIASWVLAFVLQTGAMAISLMELAMIEEYADRMNNALELEHVINPLLVAGMSVRCFACLQCILTRSWFLLLMGSLEVAYDVAVAQRRSLLMDATTIWKELGTFRTDGRIRLAYNMIMVVVAVFHLVYSLYTS